MSLTTFAIRCHVATAILGGCVGLMLGGCAKKDPPVWSMQVPSPGGEWRAIAETFVWTGPGTNDGETTLRIERGAGRDLYSSEVLAVGDGGASLGLSMKWLSPTHLLIVIKEDPSNLQEQVVKIIRDRHLAEV